MIKYLANIGMMSALCSPAMLKLVPRVMFGVVLKKVTSHYIRSGHYLQEAMEEATERAFLAIALGLHPNTLRSMFRSRAFREFVHEFRDQYLEDFLKHHPTIERETFCKESAAWCRRTLKQLETLIEEIVPQEEDVHAFFSDRCIEHAKHWQTEGEAVLIQRLRQVGEPPAMLIDLFRHEHLLFHAIHYFFRQALAKQPAVKAIFDELSELQLVNSVEEARHQQQVMHAELMRNQRQLSVISTQLQQASLAERQRLEQERSKLTRDIEEVQVRMSMWQEQTLAQAEALQTQFLSQFSHFEKRLGARLHGIQDAIQHMRQEILGELKQIDAHLSRQDQVLDEIARMMRGFLARGSSVQELVPVAGSMMRRTFHNMAAQPWQQSFTQHALRAGIGDGTVKALVHAIAETPTATKPPVSQQAPHLLFELVADDEAQPRSFYVFLKPRLTMGRHSRNDLVTYWYPLPSPASPENPAWQNWQNSGECHPCLNLSGHHMDLWWDGQTLQVCDLSSKGSFLHGERLPKGRMVALQDGAVLSLADVLRLSYSVLRDPNGRPIGWRMRRLNNDPGREEYLYLAPQASLSLGASSLDHIAFAGQGVRASHLTLKHASEGVFVLPSAEEASANGAALAMPQKLTEGTRLELGSQVLWCFPSL